MGSQGWADLRGRGLLLVASFAVAALVAAMLTTTGAAADTLFSKIPGQLPEVLAAPAASLLPDGDVLIAGGLTETETSEETVTTADLFDPATGEFTMLPSKMAVAREEMPAVTLPSGKVLLAGGDNFTEESLQTAELFNPVSEKFEPTGEMTTPRDGAGAALLPDGEVLVVGGDNSEFKEQKTAELYDPATGKFKALAHEAKVARYLAGAVALPDGKILIAGGEVEPTGPVATAELYDPATETFESLEGPGRELSEPREGMGAVLMQDGLVLIAGGGNRTDRWLSTEETFNSETDTFEKLTAELTEPRNGPAAATLADGRVLLAGGSKKIEEGGKKEIVELKSAEETSIVAPAATTTPASAVGQSTATANATVQSEAVGSVYFQYGTSASYGLGTARQPLSGSLSANAVSAALAGLTPGTTYHYRVVAENAGGTSYGPDQTFSTTALPTLPNTGPPLAQPPAPRITGLSESHRSWREGSRLASISSAHRPPVGTTFKLTLSAAAGIELVFAEQLPGRSVGHSCVVQTPANRHRRACTRSSTRGTLTLSGHAGTDQISFQGRLSHGKLPAGTYTVTVTAVNGAGSSAPQKLTFTIVR